ncbi:hypothetical protein MNEG_4085 [Monoraphidium neglectum]|uniref:Poly(A) RNA polymerase mitochondrial-like central palm domain-containing protein n=1 Tax=Monoraphidium neglectum TaxID=145388 RepID=A0A0D2JZC4_9CHLO|nr:hypothetical protein MNEG_4085 [Monoraphidium neglectum]KIZ03868.1 hypothetical protein MNEG_4085 [Monoraphidium neglectum]|eukprot:XP_013902887.1 hypothetical protein MNEG_4085 [Monoraphidium neglectum]
MAQHGGQQKINFGGTAYKFHIYRGGVLGGGAAAACLDDDGFGSLGGGTDEGLDPQHNCAPRARLDPFAPAQEIAQLAVLSHPGAGPRDQQQQKEEQEGQEQQPADKASNGGGFFIELGSSDDEDESEDEEEDEEEQLRQKKKRRRRSADEAQQQQEREREQRGRGEGGSDEEGQEGEQQEEEAADEPEEEEEPEFIGLGLSAEAAAAAGLASDSEEDPSEAAARREGRAFGYQPPWHRAVAGFRSPSLKLHNEIVCFCKMLEPTVEESSARRDSVAEVAAVAAGIFPGCKLEVYGSYATGLYTPASDVDCVLTGGPWSGVGLP